MTEPTTAAELPTDLKLDRLREIRGAAWSDAQAMYLTDLAEARQQDGSRDYRCDYRCSLPVDHAGPHLFPTHTLAALPPSALPHEHQFVNPANEVVADNGYHVCVICGLLRPPSAPPALDVEVYVDRNLVVQVFAQTMERDGYQVWWGEDESEPDWPVLYVETDEGQVSWHIPEAERLYEPPIRPEHGAQKWDGHTTPEKFDRLRARLQEPER